jgi:uncharacterized protein
MFLDLNDIGDGALSFDRTLTLARVREGSPDLLEAPSVRLHGTVTAGPESRGRAEGAGLRGRLEGALRLRCCRCLEPFDQTCATDFRLTLLSKVPTVEDPDHHVDSSETGFFKTEGAKLDLESLAAEQVYLNLPLKPLCTPSCAGLCPTCGSNRNLLECDCREETLDPGLQTLQQIRDKMGPSRG